MMSTARVPTCYPQCIPPTSQLCNAHVMPCVGIDLSPSTSDDKRWSSGYSSLATSLVMMLINHMVEKR
jgi:hypothetical protein